MTASFVQLPEVRLALPKGRMFDQIKNLFADAGIRIRNPERDYRPALSLDGFNTKILKPRNVIGMLQEGARDIGFAGNDWVAETGSQLVELFDTGLDPVRLVAAAPHGLLENGQLPRRRMVVASEYTRLAENWIAERGIDAHVLTTYGATEVFPPEDADIILDNTASGATLRANGLVVLDEVLRSSTRLYAHPRSLEDSRIRQRIDDLVMLLQSALAARSRVMVDLNCAAEGLERIVRILPCMKEPTISELRTPGWLAVRAAVPRDELTRIVLELKAAGASDIVTTRPEQIVV